MAKPYRYSASSIFAITPSDTVNFTNRAYQIYVGGTGNVSLVMDDGSDEILSAVPAGTFIKDVVVRRINATGTTATSLIGFA